MTLTRNYFSVFLFIKKTKLLKSNKAPICLYAHHHKGKAGEIQIKRSVTPEKWNIHNVFTCYD